MTQQLSLSEITVMAGDGVKVHYFIRKKECYFIVDAEKYGFAPSEQVVLALCLAERLHVDRFAFFKVVGGLRDDPTYVSIDRLVIDADVWGRLIVRTSKQIALREGGKLYEWYEGEKLPGIDPEVRQVFSEFIA